MKDIIDLNYKYTVRMGLITDTTCIDEFLTKIDKELMQFKYEVLNGSDAMLNKELAEVILTCLNFAKHYNIDIEEEMKKKIQINLNR